FSIEYPSGWWVRPLSAHLKAVTKVWPEPSDFVRPRKARVRISQPLPHETKKHPKYHALYCGWTRLQHQSWCLKPFSCRPDIRLGFEQNIQFEHYDPVSELLHNQSHLQGFLPG